MSRLLNLILILAVTSGCAHFTPGPAVTRRQIIKTAEAYANHQWQATPANVLHGTDAAGVWIDTPDVEFWGPGGWYADGRVNIGVPYCWGGASTLVAFDRGLRQGRPAGYHFRGPRQGHRGSALPIGVDCSGLVSRCWRLRTRRSTYDLGQICNRLPSYDDLRPGDALNKPYNHVILFAGWLDDGHQKMRVFEAGHAAKGDDPANYERAHRDVYDRDWLIQHGYIPLRYKRVVDNP